MQFYFSTFPFCLQGGDFGDARDGTLLDPTKIITKLHGNRGRALGQQIERILFDLEGDNVHLRQHVGEVLEHCEVCRTFDCAPYVPLAGTSAVPMFNGEVQVGLLCLDGIVASLPMDFFSRYPLLPPPRTRNPQEVWDACPNLRVGIFGPPKCIRMDVGGEWKNEV